MNSEEVTTERRTFAVHEVESPQTSDVRLIFGHGWGQSGAAFQPLAEILKPFWPSSLIDFPGFGKSALPPETWGTADYADAVAEWLRTLPAAKFVWVGHSFGGRVGIQLAARHPALLAAMVLIAGAGLQRKRSLLERLQMNARVMTFKVAKRFVREGPQLDRLRQRFGSADYRQAGAMRSVFLRAVREDLTNEAKRVDCPTLLLYGTRDTETPPEMGERLQRLIPRAELALLDGFTHLNILTEGRHQVAMRIRRFLE
ncbi:MAG: alpha/beta fold hydrolase, partial [Acidobacteriaceae bacterium]|nr:alpha/beta fold hydrolase [Acidobacteriaceae bacterium]